MNSDDIFQHVDTKLKQDGEQQWYSDMDEWTNNSVPKESVFPEKLSLEGGDASRLCSSWIG